MIQQKSSLTNKSIVLIGFMGVGKTTIGKELANLLQREFVDIDDEIEKKYQMPIPQIFKEQGETAFREKEKEVISSFCKKKLQVISVGGGAFLQEEVRNLCMSSSIVVFLELSWESWKERIHLLMDDRPVLQGKTMDEIEELYHKRKQIYASHHLKVETDGKDPEEIANYIVESLKQA
ncbi:shikimate kinase [Aquibacillus albus]|uniref:Shikimate kinase n=1 Tax=Aquibacillus albus TaxID=1168171 RepID=A0ABS2MYZ7_9BACI|nr:shikimate kinase [Aquibacillus albus]